MGPFGLSTVDLWNQHQSKDVVKSHIDIPEVVVCMSTLMHIHTGDEIRLQVHPRHPGHVP